MTCIYRRNARRLRAFRAANAAPSLLATAMAVASVLPVYPAYAAPVGGAVTAGDGSINSNGAVTTITQNQSSPRLAINWQSFSSAAGETINFIQKPTDIALNRVTGTSPSQLMGNLNAGGQVFILNPNGVLFGAGSKVNVGSLLASTLDIKNADFMNSTGTYTLHGSSNERVVNKTSLTAAEGGYIALLGPKVVNEGSITATRGAALLAAGDTVTLQLDGSSLIGYTINLGSLDALVDNSASGVISANGGKVMLGAGAADAVSKAVVNHAGLIEAKTLESKAGSIKLIGDANVGQVTVKGTLTATSPASGNSAVSIETSAASVQIDDSAKVTTAGSNGTPGTWQIKANNFEIAADSSARTASSIGATTLANTLGYTNVPNSTVANSNVAISTATTGAGSGQGDIVVNGTVAWQGFGKLTLQARRNIVFNASLAGASVSLLYGQGSEKGDGADFYFNNGAKIFLNGKGGTFDTTKGSQGDLKTYIIVRSLNEENATDGSTLQGVSSPQDAPKNYALGADINGKDFTFSPLANFFGTFEGLGHNITDLKIEGPGSTNLGLFSAIGAGAVVQNLNIIKADISGFRRTGILAGTNSGTIRNVHVTGEIRGTDQRTGGLVGVNSGTISSSHSDANVTGTRIAGGLVGENSIDGVISDSYASGAVSAGSPEAPADPEGHGYAGGLVGFNSARITGSYASGPTAGQVAVGGLVGGNMGIIEYSYATGVVNGNLWVGGLVGEARTGTVIKNAYAAGEVNGISSVGGLVGKAETKTNITNTYATGAVVGKDPTTTRGLVGEPADGVVAGSYWNTDTSAEGGTGQKSSGAGVGITGAQLQQAATFSDWDIATTGGTEKAWRIYEGHSKPLLRSFLAPLVLGSSPSVVYDGKGRFNPAIPTTGARTGTAASGRNVGTYLPYSNQQGYDISNGELVITPLTLNLRATADNKVYDGNTKASITLTGTPLQDDNVTATFTAADFDNKNIGTAKRVNVTGFTLGGTSAGNYMAPSQVFTSASITPRPLDITATATDKVYDGTTTAQPLLQDNRIAGDALVTSAVASFDDKNAGAAKKVTVSGITVAGTDAGNYLYQPQVATTSASITPRAIAITATAADKVYDGTTLARPTLQDNRVAGDALVTNAVASFDDKNAGAAKKVTVSGVTVAGADAGNYLYQPQTLTTSARITPRPLAITATAADKPYDGTTQTSATLSNNRLAGDAVTASYQRADFADKNGGQQKTVTVSGIALGGADAPNYQANSSTTTTASVTPIPLTITANPATKLADGVPYQGGNGVSYAGFLPGENATVLDGTLRYGGDAQRAMKAGQYRITPGGLASVNYASTFVDGTLTIQPLPPDAGQIASYIEPSIRAPLAPAGGKSGGTALSGVECGMRMPENLLFGECQSAPQPGGPTR